MLADTLAQLVAILLFTSQIIASLVASEKEIFNNHGTRYVGCLDNKTALFLQSCNFFC